MMAALRSFSDVAHQPVRTYQLHSSRTPRPMPFVRNPQKAETGAVVPPVWLLVAVNSCEERVAIRPL